MNNFLKINTWEFHLKFDLFHSYFIACRRWLCVKRNWKQKRGICAISLAHNCRLRMLVTANFHRLMMVKLETREASMIQSFCLRFHHVRIRDVVIYLSKGLKGSPAYLKRYNSCPLLRTLIYCWTLVHHTPAWRKYWTLVYSWLPNRRRVWNNGIGWTFSLKLLSRGDGINVLGGKFFKIR